MSFYSKFVKAKIKRAYKGETPDPTPMAPPIGYKKQPSIWEQQREMIRQIRLQEHDDGMETFEEADDFDVDDDFEPSTPFEKGFDPVEEPPTPPNVPPQAAPPQTVAPEAPPAVPTALKAP